MLLSHVRGPLYEGFPQSTFDDGEQYNVPLDLEQCSFNDMHLLDSGAPPEAEVEKGPRLSAADFGIWGTKDKQRQAMIGTQGHSNHRGSGEVLRPTS